MPAENIQRLLKMLMGDGGSGATSMEAIVVAVDMDQLTIDVKPVDDGPEVFTVRLRAAIDAEEKGGTYLIPKLESTVIIAMLDTDNAYLALATEVDQVITRIEDMEMLGTKDGIQFKVGTVSIKQALTDLITAVKQLTVMTNTGVSTPPQAPTQQALTDVQTKLNTLFP